MGKHGDFYVRVEKLEWIGSTLKNGDVWNVPLDILIQINQIMFEELTYDFIRKQNGIISSEGGKWPHIWPDSRMTDFAYIFDTQYEKVFMYQQGIDYLINPVKIIQGWSLMEANELVPVYKFPLMNKADLFQKEELIKNYGYSITDSL